MPEPSTPAPASGSSPLRVLHVISGLRASAGGTVTALSGLSRSQLAAGCQISIAATFIQPEDSEADAFRKFGIAVHPIGPCRDPMSRHPAIAPTMARLVGEHDVVHIHGLWEQIQHEAAKAARQASVPYVISPHGMLDPWSLGQGAWKKKLYLMLRLRKDLNRASAIHYATAAERDLAAPLKLRAPRRSSNLSASISPSFLHRRPRGTFRAKYAISPQAKLVLFLSRLHPKKGLDLLIPSAAQSLGAQDRLVIAGPDWDGYQPQLQKLIEAHAFSSRVLFTGMLRGAQRIEALVDADLFVLPSYQENFGIAVVEALAAGCPVVISDQVNICRQIAAENVGQVVPTQVDPLAAAIKRWLGDDELRARAAALGPAFVRREFDWNRIARHWCEHYRALKRS